MQFREQTSTSAKLGCRVDGVRLADEVDGHVPDSNELKKVADEHAMREVLRAYAQGRCVPTSLLPCASTFHLRLSHSKCRTEVLSSFASQCAALLDAFEGDGVAAHHSFIRSSLLFVYSDVTNQTSVHMIDFARCYATERPLNHRTLWAIGNHEDGYLSGLNNLIGMLQGLASSSKI